MMQLIEEHASSQSFNRVTKVYVEMGAFAAVEVDAMRFCFDIVSRHTRAEDADLIITQFAAAAWCFDCSAAINIANRLDPCPTCGGFSLKCQSNDEMRIKELEVH
jgi:hydrogenase nickel incorporation protein HypA/HybF